jgi:hypothetical protein
MPGQTEEPDFHTILTTMLNDFDRWVDQATNTDDRIEKQNFIKKIKALGKELRTEYFYCNNAETQNYYLNCVVALKDLVDYVNNPANVELSAEKLSVINQKFSVITQEIAQGSKLASTLKNAETKRQIALRLILQFVSAVAGLIIGALPAAFCGVLTATFLGGLLTVPAPIALWTGVGVAAAVELTFAAFFYRWAAKILTPGRMLSDMAHQMESSFCSKNLCRFFNIPLNSSRPVKTASSTEVLATQEVLGLEAKDTRQAVRSSCVSSA